MTPNWIVVNVDRLGSLSTLTTIRFGVIPFEVQYTVAPVHGFYVYDKRMVRVENLTAVLKLTQPSEIAAYTKIFDQFAEVARYGAEARAIITRVLADLTANTE